jgi:hypothetical protein
LERSKQQQKTDQTPPNHRTLLQPCHSLRGLYVLRQ